MATYEVRFSVRVPEEVNATPAEVEAWLRFECHDNGELSLENPLSAHCPVPMRGTFRVLPSAGFTVPTYTPRLTPVGAGDGNTYAVG